MIALLAAAPGDSVGHAARSARSAEEDIKALEARLAAATRTGDVSALAQLCHPDYVAIPSGILGRHGKDDLLRAVREERVKFSSYSSKILWITMSANMATVGAQDSLTLLPDQPPFPYRTLRVYVRDGSSWTLRMAHSDACETCSAE